MASEFVATHSTAVGETTEIRTRRHNAVTAERFRRNARQDRHAGLAYVDLTTFASTTGQSTARSDIADTGINQYVQEVDDEVSHDDGAAHHDKDSKHHRVIMLDDGVKQQPADAGPGKYNFRHDRAGKHRAEMQAQNGQDWFGGIAKRVVQKHPALG